MLCEESRIRGERHGREASDSPSLVDRRVGRYTRPAVRRFVRGFLRAHGERQLRSTTWFIIGVTIKRFG